VTERRRARWASTLVGLSIALSAAEANGAPFWAYRATLSVAAQSASFENDVDRIVVTKLTSKTVINAVLGQPLRTRVPKNLVLVVLVPTSRTPLGARLGILDRDSGNVTTIASVFQATLLRSDAGRTQGVGVGEAQVGSLPAFGASPAAAELFVSAFLVAGTAKGRFTDASDAPGLSLRVSGLHARYDRTGPPPDLGSPFYAGVISKGRLRASGKPLATVDI